MCIVIGPEGTKEIRKYSQIRTKARTFYSTGAAVVCVSGIEFSRNMAALMGRCRNPRTLFLPETVAKIASGAFIKSKHLRAIVLDENLEEIGDIGFCKSGLRKIEFPAKLKRIGRCAFRECWCLKHARFQKESELEQIEGWCFSKSRLEEVVTPSTLKVIEDGVFCECKNLRHAILNMGLEVLGDSAFSESGIKSLAVPGSVMKLGSNTFFSCAQLENIQLEFGLEEIGQRCFECSGLISVAIPASVKALGDSAFLDC